MVKAFIVSLAAVLLSFGAAAQPVWEKFVSAVSGRCVSFPYSCVSRGKVTVKTDGNVKVQGSSFIVKTGGMEIRCDGRARWIVDRNAGEVVIESVDDGSGVSAAVDPAVLVNELGRYFAAGRSSVVKNGSQTLTETEFRPVSSSSDVSGISTMTMWFKDSSSGRPSIVRAVLKMKDGTENEFSIPSMSFSAPEPASVFRFDSAGYDASWVITDLR